MLQWLVRLNLPINAVFEDELVTPKPEHHALLLKDKMWVLADDLAQVLSPAERATALLFAQSYVTIAFVLPIVSFLVKYLPKEETKTAAEQGTVCCTTTRVKEKVWIKSYQSSKYFILGCFT